MEAISPAKSETIRVKSTSDGIHLTGSILWFDSFSRGELSFLSSALSPVKTTVPQVIATEETIKILEAVRRKPNALVCQYNRPFSIGRLKIELLPSGSVLGGASIFVETAKGKFLYAPFLQPHRIPTVRQMQLKKANTLIIAAHHPDPAASLPPRKKEKDRLLGAVRERLNAGAYPVIFCHAIGTAQELTQLLSENQIPLAVHSSIFRINKVYEAYGSQLGNYSHYSKRYGRNSVVILPLSNLGSPLRRRIPDGPIFYVEDGFSQSLDPSAFRQVTDRFHISSSCDGRDLREIITNVDPRELFIFGPYARRYVEMFGELGPKVRPLFPDEQPALF